MDREKVEGRPEMGSRAVAGKSNKPDGNLIEPPKAEKVVDAKEVKGATLDAVKVQVGTPDGTRRTAINSPDCCE